METTSAGPAEPAEPHDVYLPGYSEGAHQNHARRTAATHAAWFLLHLRPGMRVLDCACGPGTVTVDLAAAIAPGEIIGLDIEPLQIERGRTLARERGVANARFEIGDIYALPFSDASFDAVFANAIFIHLRELPAALQQIRRVLRPGGVAGIADPSGSVIEPSTPLVEAYVALWERVRRHQLGRPMRASARYRELLLQAGFARSEGYGACQAYGTPQLTRAYARRRGEVLREPALRALVLEQGWADEALLEAMAAEFLAWGERPDAFAMEVWCAAVGWTEGSA